MEQGGPADTELPGAGGHGGVELRVQGAGHELRHGLGQGRGSGHEGRLLDPGQVLAPGRGVRGGVPGGDVAQVLAEVRGLGQHGLVLARGSDEGEQLLEEHRLGPRVREQVVLRDHQFTRAVRKVHGERADQRGTLRVDAPVELLRRRPLHLLGRAHRGLVPRHGPLRQQELHGRGHPAVGEARPQHRVAPVHGVARAAHGSEVHVRPQREAVLDHVGVRAVRPVHERLQVHALLQRRQRQHLLPLRGQPLQDLPQLGGDGHGEGVLGGCRVRFGPGALGVDGAASALTTGDVGGIPGTGGAVRALGTLHTDCALGTRRALGIHRARGAPGARGQLTQAGVREDVRDREVPAALPQPRDQAQGGDAVPAQPEEVVLRSAAGQAEQLVHGGAHGTLRLGARCGPARRGTVRLRQGGAVDLPVRGRRQARNLRDDRRDHVLRQQLAQGVPGGGSGGLLRGVVVTRGDHVAEQPVLAAGIGAHARGRGAHGGQRAQRGLDLAELDAVPADLDLVVHAPQEVQLSLAAHHQVAGAVQPRPGVRGVGDEARRGLGRSTQISPSHLDAAQVELSGDAVGHGPQGVVEHRGLHAVPRGADRHGTGAREVLGRDRLVGHPHRGLGGSVHVADLRAALPHARGEVPVQGLAAHEGAHPAQVHVPVLGGLHETAPQRGRGLQDVRVRPSDDAQQGLGIADGCAVREVHGAAHAQRREQLQAGDVERHGGDRHERVPVPDPAQLDHGAQERGNVRTRDHHALGPPGGAGGVQDVGQAIVRGGDLGQGRGGQAAGCRRRLPGAVHAFLFRGAGSVQQQHVRVGRGKGCGELGRGDHECHGGVLEHLARALTGVVRIQRHVDRAHALHRQQGGQQRAIARQRHGHHRLLPHPTGDEPRGQVAHRGVKFRVGEVALCIPQRHAVRCAGHLLREGPGHTRRAHLREAGDDVIVRVRPARNPGLRGARVHCRVPVRRGAMALCRTAGLRRIMTLCRTVGLHRAVGPRRAVGLAGSLVRDRQLGDGAARVLDHLLQHAQHAVREGGDGLGIEEVRGPHDAQRGGALVHEPHTHVEARGGGAHGDLGGLQ